LQYKVLLYSLDGRCQATYSAYEMALGVKSVAWSSTSQFLAIGSYDQKVPSLHYIVNYYLSTADVHVHIKFHFAFNGFTLSCWWM